MARMTKGLDLSHPGAFHCQPPGPAPGEAPRAQPPGHMRDCHLPALVSGGAFSASKGGVVCIS